MLKTSGYGHEVGLRRLADQPPKGGFVSVSRDLATRQFETIEVN